MTALRTYVLVCDGCGARWFKLRPEPVTIKATRLTAFKHGWTAERVRRAPSDWCPDCSALNMVIERRGTR